MSSNRGSNRRRGRGSNRQQGGQQLNRIDSRARGNAPQLLEKYRKLAHDAHLNGDRVQEEYYLQFADHYFRVIADTRQRQEDGRQRRDDRWQDNDEGADSSDYGSDSYTESEDTPRVREVEASPEKVQNAEASEESRNGSEAPASVYEPAENPFVRENRGGRGLKPRRPRRDESSEGGEGGGLDPASLPPSISVNREEAPAPEAEPEAAAEAKPRRRPRRKPSSDDTGEALQSVG